MLLLIGKAALNEARRRLDTHQKTGQYLTDISERNLFKYQLLDYLESIELTDEALIKCLMSYCPPLLRKSYRKEVLSMPDIHKKAVISLYPASHLIYVRGLDWSPNIADALPMIARSI